MNENTQVATRRVSPMAEVRVDLERMSGQFKAALPAHIPLERFARVVMTAIQNNPRLMNCSRTSLWNAAVKAAQDGLLPDGREGAIIDFKGQAMFLPMVAGIRKKARNSGEITTWDSAVVYENDLFQYQLGDNPFIDHKPALTIRGDPVAVYSVCTLKSGEKSREVMTVDEINGIKKRSLMKNPEKGPWGTDWGEMARKTVIKRHAKSLPMSTDLDDLIRRDDGLYDMEGAREKSAENTADIGRSALDAFAGMSEPAAIDHDAETGEVTEETTESEGQTGSHPEDAKSAGVDSSAPAGKAAKKEKAEKKPEPKEEAAPVTEEDIEAARDAGAAAREKGRARKAVPGAYRETPALVTAWQEGFDGEAAAGEPADERPI